MFASMTASVSECMSECLYASQTGWGSVFWQYQVYSLSSPPPSTLSQSHALLIWKQSRDKEWENDFWIIKHNLSPSKAQVPCPALNINNLTQVSVSHIWLMHATVNNHTVSHDSLRKPQVLGTGSKRHQENVCLSKKMGQQTGLWTGAVLGGCGRIGGWKHQTVSRALQATSDLGPFGVRSLSRYLNLFAGFWPVLPFWLAIPQPCPPHPAIQPTNYPQPINSNCSLDNS